MFYTLSRLRTCREDEDKIELSKKFHFALNRENKRSAYKMAN